MNQAKVERAAKCLQAVALIYVIQVVYVDLKLLTLSENLSALSSGMGSGFLGTAAISMAMAAALAIAAFVVSREIKSGTGWAWIAGVSLCLFTLPSFCLPASLLGLLTLLDKEVREPYLATFEFKF